MNPTSDDIQLLAGAINALAEMLHQIFAVPESALLAAAWAAGFTIPATVGLVAWIVAKLVSMFDN